MSIDSGCACDEKYDGQIEPAAAPPYYWGFCLPPAEAATQASRAEAEKQRRGSVAASVTTDGEVPSDPTVRAELVERLTADLTAHVQPHRAVVSPPGAG